jgi:hypothetical protein
MNAPLSLIGTIAILVYRFGWPGVLVVVVIVLIFPLQILVGKINGKII